MGTKSALRYVDISVQSGEENLSHISVDIFIHHPQYLDLGVKISYKKYGLSPHVTCVYGPWESNFHKTPTTYHWKWSANIVCVVKSSYFDRQRHLCWIWPGEVKMIMIFGTPNVMSNLTPGSNSPCNISSPILCHCAANILMLWKLTIKRGMEISYTRSRFCIVIQ